MSRAYVWSFTGFNFGSGVAFEVSGGFSLRAYAYVMVAGKLVIILKASEKW